MAFNRLFLVGATCIATCAALATAPRPEAAQIAQESFASPDEAAKALADATRSKSSRAFNEVLGPAAANLESGDRYADEEQQRRFAAAYDEKHALVQQGPDRVILTVGNNDWPLPIPIVRSAGRWQFDTAAGAQELINRRIGRDELSAVRVLLTYVDAQKDYFARVKEKSGAGVYAERLMSTPGREDGLFWPAAADAPQSPLAPLVARADQEGYAGAFTGTKAIPYQGYYFRILKAQGVNTPEGARNYVKSGKMTEGFALIAWPARYGSSGIMTFQVSQDGIVFQKDLGPKTDGLAPAMTAFDADLSWDRVDVTND